MNLGHHSSVDQWKITNLLSWQGNPRMQVRVLSELLCPGIGPGFYPVVKAVTEYAGSNPVRGTRIPTKYLPSEDVWASGV